MTSVGEYLKSEREARQLSVQEVADLTKISERYLVCIEGDNYDQLPAGPYAKGYIAAYARQVCGDEARALALYAQYCTATQCALAEGEPAGDLAAETPPSVDRPASNGSATLQAGAAKGLQLFNSLRRVLPERGNLRHLSAGSAPKGRALIDRLLVALRTLAARTADTAKGHLFKGLLFGTGALACAGVLVLAGFGAYHLFFEGPADGGLPPNRMASTDRALIAPSGKRAAASTPPAVAPNESAEGQPAAHDGPSTADEPPPSPTISSAEQERAVADPAMETHQRAATTAAAASAPAAQRSKSTSRTRAERQADRSEMASANAAQLRTPLAEPSTPQATDTPSIGEAIPARGDGTIAMRTLAPGAAHASSSPPAIPFRLVKASVCTAVADRMPVGVSERFAWSTPKIYVWSLLSTDQPPAKVRHIYYHGDRMVSNVVLKVGSSHWRTWSFHTLAGQVHKGPWHVDIATLDGRVLRRLHFSIE